MTVAELIAQAKQKLDAGDLDGAKALRDQAAMLKDLEALETPAPAPKEEVKRLDFGNPAPVVEQSTAATKAIEVAYVKKFGNLDESVNQVMRELYGTESYALIRAAKMADMNRYLRTNTYDPRFQKMVLLTPDQVLAAIMTGVPVADGQYTIKATMVEAQDTLGGYLVPEEYNQDMVERLPGLTVVRSRAKKYNTSRDALSFLVRTGGDKRRIGAVRSKMTSENPTGTYSTNATWGKLAIPVHVNLSKVPVTKSLLEDATMNIMSDVLMPEFQTDQAILEDQQFLCGSGSDEPQGILKPDFTAPWSPDTVTQNTGSAAAVNFDGMVAAPFKLGAQYRARKNPNVAWTFNANTAASIAALKDLDGAYYWAEIRGNNAVGNPDTIRGWQYAESEALPNEAANVYVGIFGDFSGYRIVDRIGMSVERYSDSATADTDTVVFYCRRRYGGQVAEGWKFVGLKCST